MSIGKSAKIGLIRGSMMGAALCLWVTGIYALQGERPFRELGTSYPAAMASYLAIGVVTGIIIGALLPFAKSTVGAYCVGFPAALAIALGIILSVYGVPSHWEDDAYGFVGVVTIVATIAIGNEINRRRRN